MHRVKHRWRSLIVGVDKQFTTEVCTCQGTPYFTSHFQLLWPPLQHLLPHSSLHPSTLQIPLVTSLRHSSDTSACPLLTPTSQPYDFRTSPFSLHLFIFSYLFLCRYISIATMPPLPLLQLSLVIWTYLSYFHFSHIMPFNYLILFHFYFIYLLFPLTPYLVLKPYPPSRGPLSFSFRTSCKVSRLLNIILN